MFRVRTFNNDFAVELNNIFDAPEGIYFSFLRLRIFIDSVNEQITLDNRKIISEIQKEDPEIGSSMINQFDIDCSLNYFNNILLSSIFISSYTILEHKLRDVCIVCGKYKDKDYQKYRKKNGNKNDLLAPKSFLEDNLKLNLGLLVDAWGKLEDYHKLRKLIIHGHNENKILKLIQLINIKCKFELLENGGRDLNKLFVIDFIDKAYYLLDELIKFLNSEYNLISYD